MIIDLLGPSKAAIFTVLSAAVSPDLAKVLDVIPQGTEPNFIAIGALDSEPDLSIFEQLEKITIEVQYIYRGQDRDVLIQMMAIGRQAIDLQRLPATDGAVFDLPRCTNSNASTAGPDGVTFAGIQNFVFLAQPAG